MGDVGGLAEALYLLTLHFVQPISVIVMKSNLLSLFFKLVKGRDADMLERSEIPYRGFLRSAACCGKSRYRRMIDRANSLITRQLDLVKFVHRQRMLVLAALASMNKSQRNFRDDLS